MRCIYCFPKSYTKLPRCELLSFEEIMEIVDVFKKLGLKKIRVTGGEPLIRKGVCQFIKELSSAGVPVYISTNGAFLGKFAESLKNSGINRVNVSVDSLKEEKFAFITKTNLLSQVLKSIEKARKAGLEVKINTVLMKNLNDNEIFDFLNYFLPQRIKLRFIEFMPFPHTKNLFKDFFIPYEKILEQISKRYSVNYLGVDGVAQVFEIKELNGTVGFISPVSKPFCQECNRLRLTASGKLKVCLHNGWEFDLKGILRSGRKHELEKTIRKALALKKQINSPCWEAKRSMVEIGG